MERVCAVGAPGAANRSTVGGGFNVGYHAADSARWHRLISSFLVASASDKDALLSEEPPWKFDNLHSILHTIITVY